MIVGYARTSTADQIAGFDAQIQELKAAGCQKMFQEQVSSVGKRAQLEAALEYVREGDVLVVTKLDRLARSMADLMVMIQRVLAEPHWWNLMKPEDFRALSPLIYAHINPYGIFELDMSTRLPIEEMRMAA